MGSRGRGSKRAGVCSAERDNDSESLVWRGSSSLHKFDPALTFRASESASTVALLRRSDGRHRIKKNRRAEILRRGARCSPAQDDCTTTTHSSIVTSRTVEGASERLQLRSTVCVILREMILALDI